jgi:hypothetical protein
VSNTRSTCVLLITLLAKLRYLSASLTAAAHLAWRAPCAPVPSAKALPTMARCDQMRSAASPFPSLAPSPSSPPSVFSPLHMKFGQVCSTDCMMVMPHLACSLSMNDGDDIPCSLSRAGGWAVHAVMTHQAPAQLLRLPEQRRPLQPERRLPRCFAFSVVSRRALLVLSPKLHWDPCQYLHHRPVSGQARQSRQLQRLLMMDQQSSRASPTSSRWNAAVASWLGAC